jgi:FlaA1/EpsC-like NDP-sugar epimerase
MKRILITGMAGSIGSELARQLAPEHKIFGIDINETGLYQLREQLRAKGHWVYSRTGDIRNKETLKDVFEDFKPQIVFHAAALKNVTPSEEYPQEAIDTNIQGTANVIAEAKRWECLEKFVFISTDKVVNAKCIMGITKKCAEGLITRAGEQFVAVRFGNVLASSGSVLEIWAKQVEQGLPITITDPRMERYMMTIPDACELVIKAQEGSDGDTYVLDMGKKVNIMELKNKYYPNEPFTIIGIRPGETLTEEIMSDEEKKRAIRDGNFWILKS